MSRNSLTELYLSNSEFSVSVKALTSVIGNAIESMCKAQYDDISVAPKLSANYIERLGKLSIPPTLRLDLTNCISSVGNSVTSSVISASTNMMKKLLKDTPTPSDLSLDGDFVIMDQESIKEYEIPETIAIPIGHNRIKIKTTTLIAIISGILLPVLFHLSDTIIDLHQSAAEAKTEQQRIEIEQERNDLTHERNMIYKQWYDAFQSLDSSHSSQSESIELLKKSLPSIDSNPEVPDSDPR